MTNDTTMSKRRYWPQKTWQKMLLVLAIVFVVYVAILAAGIGASAVTGDNSPGIPFLTDDADAATAYSAAEINAIGPGLYDDTRLQATLNSGNAEAYAAFLPYAQETIENTYSLGSYAITGHPIQAGCHFKVWRRISLYLRGHFIHPVIAWRRVAIDEWCWSASVGHITLTVGDPDDGKWTFPGYCWTDVTYRKGPLSDLAWYTYAQSTLKSCTRLSPQKTIKPSITFHAATTTRPYGFWHFDNTPAGIWYH